MEDGTGSGGDKGVVRIVY